MTSKFSRGLETRSLTATLDLKRSLSPHEIGMDDTTIKRSDAGLYALGGVAIIIVLFWAFSAWWV